MEIKEEELSEALGSKHVAHMLLYEFRAVLFEHGLLPVSRTRCRLCLVSTVACLTRLTRALACGLAGHGG